MKYPLLIYEDEDSCAARLPRGSEGDGRVLAFGDFIREIMGAGEALVLTTTAKRVRVRDGKPMVTDRSLRPQDELGKQRDRARVETPRGTQRRR